MWSLFESDISENGIGDENMEVDGYELGSLFEIDNSEGGGRLRYVDGVEDELHSLVGDESIDENIRDNDQNSDGNESGERMELVFRNKGQCGSIDADIDEDGSVDMDISDDESQGDEIDIDMNIRSICRYGGCRGASSYTNQLEASNPSSCLWWRHNAESRVTCQFQGNTEGYH